MSKKYLKQIFNLKYQQVKKNKKSKYSFNLILMVIHLSSGFFQNFYLLIPKIEICLKHFLDKNPQKQSLWILTVLVLDQFLLCGWSMLNIKTIEGFGWYQIGPKRVWGTHLIIQNLKGIDPLFYKQDSN